MRFRGQRVKVFTLISLVASAFNLFLFRGTNKLAILAQVQPMEQHDTTIIITSSFIPSHPSLEIIDKTIESLSYLQGLSKTTPIIITVDGMYSKDRRWDARKSQILDQYSLALKKKYDQEPHISILLEKTNIRLVGNVQKAMKFVKTEFIYLVQHDMPFIAPANHTALVRTFHSHPDEVRLVRFSPRKTLKRRRDNLGLCGETEFEANGIGLSKTHTWSDNNHLTRKSYYDEMFSVIQDWDGVRYMEAKMKVHGLANCSYWGTWLYGRVGNDPMIVHLDGRRETKNRTSVS